jgi:alkaline phosphatase D
MLPLLLALLACDRTSARTRSPETDRPEDSDPAGVAEICDGVDQDGDGEIDEGIPSDGAGCRDPGPPARAATASIVHLTLRTGAGTYDGTDDGAVQVCLSADLCFDPYKEAWNDLEAGIVDVKSFEGLSVGWTTPDRFTLGTTDGSNLWRPVGAQVSLDGEVVYCRDLTVDIGSGSGETPSWADPEGLGVACDTAFDATLTHGPMVGAVGPDRARIWYRTDATRHVELYVAETEEGLGTAVHHGYPLAERDFAEVVEVVGLQPGRSYAYSLRIDGEAFGPWTFTTAPADGEAAKTRIAFGSCSKEDDQPAFGAILGWEPDLFLFIGDNHYANTSERNGLRQFYRWAHERPMRSALLARTPILATWDDHDYTGNNTDGAAPGKETALRVFQEYWANARYGTSTTRGVFGSQRWGDVELFWVDDRFHRGLDGTFLGEAQQEWLLDALAGSTATFKLVASGSQWTPYGSDDSWAAFPASLDAFRSGIVSRGIEGVVLLSGDIHRFEAREVAPAAGGYVLPEITSSPLAYPTPSLCNDDAGEPDRVLCLDAESGFVGLEIDTTAADPVITASYFDAAGNVRGTYEVRRSALELP